jgi:hypothetical protein
LFKWLEDTDITSYNLERLKLATHEIRMERRKVCNDCSSRKGFLCNECGCIIRAKTSVAQEKCPRDKWLHTEKLNN